MTEEQILATVLKQGDYWEGVIMNADTECLNSPNWSSALYNSGATTYPSNSQVAEFVALLPLLLEYMATVLALVVDYIYLSYQRVIG